MAPTALNPQQKTGRDVQRMFDGIAHRYDALNRVLSAGQDRHWRAVAVDRALAGWPGREGARVLDVCCGTGDLALQFDRHPRVSRVTGVDFVTSMVQRAALKDRHRGRWLVGDALHLPLRSRSFDVVSVAFGLRNLERPRQGIAEMSRLLRPDGRLVILEFFPPERGLSSALFRWYLHQVLPRVGRLVTGTAPIDAYRYLPDSMESFAPRDEVRSWLAQAGLRTVTARSFLFGTVGLLVAARAAAVEDPLAPPIPETAGLVRIA